MCLVYCILGRVSQRYTALLLAGAEPVPRRMTWTGNGRSTLHSRRRRILAPTYLRYDQTSNCYTSDSISTEA